jgi:hypothetical protein
VIDEEMDGIVITSGRANRGLRPYRHVSHLVWFRTVSFRQPRGNRLRSNYEMHLHTCLFETCVQRTVVDEECA